MAKTILAIGGHIGDACLTAGGILAQNAIEGGKNYTLALTAGERGCPKGEDIKEYRVKKINEAKRFMGLLGGEAFVLDYEDGLLPNNEEVRWKVAEIIDLVKPDIVITHWHSLMHKDHNNTHQIVMDARFIASVVGTKYGKHYSDIYFAENWEDDEDFKPYLYVDITKGYDLWTKALHEHYFVMNSKDFDYYDYYISLARMRGCLARCKYAVALDIYPFDKKVVSKDFLK